jgi:hypothetical protein
MSRLRDASVHVVRQDMQRALRQLPSPPKTGDKAGVKVNVSKEMFQEIYPWPPSGWPKSADHVEVYSEWTCTSDRRYAVEWKLEGWCIVQPDGTLPKLNEFQFGES